MTTQISHSYTTITILLFALLSLASSNKVLIVCTDGCGCVTECGRSVSCPFIQLNETAVLQSRPMKNGSYRATRVIRFGTAIGYGSQKEESFDEYCPDTAGASLKLSNTTCHPAPNRTRTLLKPTKPEGSAQKYSTYSGVCEVGQFTSGNNAVIEMVNYPNPRRTEENGQVVSVNGIAFQLAACRAKPLKN